MLPLEWVLEQADREADAVALLRFLTRAMFAASRKGRVPWMVTLLHVRASILAAMERDTPDERMLIPREAFGETMLTLEGAYRGVFARHRFDRKRQDLQEGWFAAVMEEAKVETERTLLLAVASACDDADEAEADEDAGDAADADDAED